MVMSSSSLPSNVQIFSFFKVAFYAVVLEFLDGGKAVDRILGKPADRTSDNINEPFRINLTIQNRDYDRSADYYLVIQAEDDSSDITTIDYMMGIIN